MCINRTVVETGVSRHYHQFVNRDTGVISKLTGDEAFRIDVDADVTDGRSFELPVFLAHVLRKERRLAGMTPSAVPAPLWIATGEVDVDHRVKAVDGLAQKFKTLEDWLLALPPGSTVRLFLPASNRAEAEPLLAPLAACGVSVRFLERTEEALGGAPEPAAASPVTAQSVPRRGLSLAAVVALGVVALAVVALLAGLLVWKSGARGATGSTSATRESVAPSSAQEGPAPDPVVAAVRNGGGPETVLPTLGVVVTEVRSLDGSCYGGTRRQREHRAKTGEMVVLSGDGQYCRLEVAVVETGPAYSAYLVGRDGTTMVPIPLGTRGSLTSKLIREETVLDVAFSPRPLSTAAAVASAPRLSIRLQRDPAPSSSR
jgi:hypothetical protein